MDGTNTRQARVHRLAAIVTHPIQYQVPLWKALHQCDSVELKVFYASNHGATETVDPLYGRAFAWDLPLLDGYNYEFIDTVKIPVLHGPVANRYPRGLLRRLRDGCYDAVLIHGYMTGAAWAGYRAARRLGIPIILRGDSHLKQARRGARRIVKQLLVTRFLAGVSYCLAVGQWNREYWIHYGVPAERVITTLYAVDNTRFSESASRTIQDSMELRRSWNAKSTDTVFVYSGNFQHHKGIDILIDAYARLRTHRNDVHLALIGTGQKEGELRRRAASLPAVHWLGFINQSRMPTYLQAADVFVLPSRIEPWGLVVNEAMACGLPAIVSNVVGAGPDLVAEPEAGIIVPVGSTEKLMIAMNSACDPTLRGKWKQRLDLALQMASFQKNTEAIAECLARLQIPPGDTTAR